MGSCRSWHKNHRGAASGLLSRLPDRIEYRYFAIEHLAAFARGHTCDHVRAVIHALPRVKRASAARNPLHNKSSIFIDQDRHEKLGTQELRKKKYIS